jgi:cytochrome-b5 reductase
MFSKLSLPARRILSQLTLKNERTMSSLPSSMTGPPISSLVKPGECQFGPEFTAVPLIERFPITKTSSVLRFATPDTSKPLQLSTCACILANAEIDGEDITRPYTPISTNADVGHFDLLIKSYGKDAHMSRHMHEIQPGDKINFKHIEFNVKIQAPFDEYKHIGMCVGGTGLTPMVQALHAILGQPNAPKVTMLYGSKTSDDILGKELLEKWTADYPDQFKVVDILSEEPSDSDWKGEHGFIDKAKIKQYFPPANSPDKQLIFVCGPPPMYNALSGPRDDKDTVSGVLGELGYSAEQVYKF